MAKGARAAGPRARRLRQSRSEIKDRYLVVTEGLVTEPRYFEGIQRQLHVRQHPSRHAESEQSCTHPRGVPEWTLALGNPQC